LGERDVGRTHMSWEGAVKHSAVRGQRAWVALCVALGTPLVCGAMAGSVGVAVAQARAEAVSVALPPVIQIAPGSETSFAIQVKPANAVPRRAIVLIRGLPSTVTLSEGRLFESGVWGVPAADIDKLKIVSDSAQIERQDISISLVAIDGTLLAEARSSVVTSSPNARAAAVGRAGPDDSTIYTAAPAQPDPRAEGLGSAVRLSSEQSAQLFSIVRKGDEQMAVGNVSAARLLYRHAAESGLAAGALALAASFDEQELRQRRVKGGVQADAKQAQFWYEKARELGSPEARERLQKLGAR
jgi:hypothetical protein